MSLITFKIWDKWFSLACLGFEISEYQKRQAAMTVRKVTKQKGEATRRYQVIFFTFLSSLVCSVFSSLFTLHRICFLTFLTCHIFFLNKHTHYVYEWTKILCVLRELAMASGLVFSSLIAFAAVFCCWIRCLSAHTRGCQAMLERLLSTNEKTEGCLHEGLSLKGDINVCDTWILSDLHSHLYLDPAKHPMSIETSPSHVS